MRCEKIGRGKKLSRAVGHFWQEGRRMVACFFLFLIFHNLETL